MFKKQVVFVLIGVVIFIAGYVVGKVVRTPPIHTVIAATTISPTPTNEVNPTSPVTSSNSGSFGGNTNVSTHVTPTPTLALASPFVYTPLPTNRGGPEDDIIEINPLTPNRMSAQVDDWITFTATIKNQAPYDKVLYNLCFKSTDGNFGCVFNIHLASGQSYSIQNVGSWKIAGEKQVWLEWSQDNYNYYRPVGELPVSVQIL